MLSKYPVELLINNVVFDIVILGFSYVKNAPWERQHASQLLAIIISIVTELPFFICNKYLPITEAYHNQMGFYVQIQTFTTFLQDLLAFLKHSLQNCL